MAVREFSRAIYAGSFDPPTDGHNWVFARASNLFDEVIVVIATHVQKKYMFTADERKEMLNEIFKGCNLENVRAEVIPDELIVNAARELEATHLIRGLRSVTDYDYERAMCSFNREAYEDLLTVFLMPPSNLDFVSSSMVKGLLPFNDWEEEAKKYVSHMVLDKLKEKANG